MWIWARTQYAARSQPVPSHRRRRVGFDRRVTIGQFVAGFVLFIFNTYELIVRTESIKT